MACPIPENRVNVTPITILALDSDRYRGDLECLAQCEGFRILKFPSRWQYLLMYLYYPKGYKRTDYVNPTPGSSLRKAKNQYRALLNQVLPYLHSRLGVDCVIGHSIHSIAATDWGAVSKELGWPYIVFHRESTLACPWIKELVIQRFQKLGRFEGNHVIVANQIIRQIIINTGFVSPDQITSCGVIRMDGFLQRLAEHRVNAPPAKKLVLFAFHLGILPSDPLFALFRDVLLVLSRIAARHPKVKVVIKSKPGKLYHLWKKSARIAFKEGNVQPQHITNLFVCNNQNPHDLILESTVVSALNSTTMLEAGIANKPVVVPYFGVLRDSNYNDQIWFREHFRLFDIGKTKEEFEALLLSRLEEPSVDPAAFKGRQSLFEQYVSSFDHSSIKRYIDVVREQVESGKQCRSIH